MNIIINNNKTIQVLCIYTENRHIVRNSVICVVVWYSRVVLLSVNLIFNIPVFSSSRSNSFEVIALDGVCTHILQFCTAAESTDWLQAISTNINALTQESVSITQLLEYVKPPEIRGLMHIHWTEVYDCFQAEIWICNSIVLCSDLLSTAWYTVQHMFMKLVTLGDASRLYSH